MRDDIKSTVCDLVAEARNEVVFLRTRAEEISKALDGVFGKDFSTKLQMVGQGRQVELEIFSKKKPSWSKSIFTVTNDASPDTLEENLAYIKKAIVRGKTGIPFFIVGCQNNWWGQKVVDARGHFYGMPNAYPLAINSPLDRY